MKKDYIKDLKVTNAPHSEVIIEGEIPAATLDAEYQKLLKNAYKTIEVPGFRAGKAPEHLAKSHINDMAVLDRAAEEVFRNEYPNIIEHHKLFPIDHPKISIVKLAAGNPLGFKITVEIMPKIEIPDYKTIAKVEMGKKDDKETAVTNIEVDAAILQIQKSIAHQEYHRAHPEDTEHKHDEKLPLPEITDEFVKKLGDFKDVADFKEKMKKNLEQEQKNKNKEKKRIATIEAIEKKFTIDLPRGLVNAELDRMIADMHERISNAGLKPADYYAELKKTEADLRKDWSADAEKRVKIDIILAEVAKKESIKADPKDLDEQTKNLLAYHKDANPDRARSYVEHMLINDKVFEFFEGLK